MNKDILILAKELKYLTQQSDNKKLRHFYNKNVYKSKFLFFNNVFNSEKLESNSIFLRGFNLSSETLLNLSMFSIFKNWLSDFEELTPNKPKKERIKP